MTEAVADSRPSGPFLPDLSGFRLSGRRLRLPAALESRSVLVVAFGRDQQAVVGAWVERLLAESGGVPVLEVPVFSRSELWRRGIIDGGMIDGIDDLAVLRRTITVYADLDSFCDATGIEDRSTVSVLVVEPSGRIVTAVSGPLDDDRWTEIAAAVAPG